MEGLAASATAVGKWESKQDGSYTNKHKALHTDALKSSSLRANCPKVWRLGH